jgi:hypothetical protein
MTGFGDAVFHSLKYSGQDVFGVILSRNEKPERFVPLFHSSCVSVSIMRTALSLIDSMTEYHIIAVYYASNKMGTVPAVAHILANQISAVKGKTVTVWRLEVSNISDPTRTKIQFIMTDSEEKNKFSQDMDSRKLKEKTQDGSYAFITDFEDFLGYPKAEWIES